MSENKVVATEKVDYKDIFLEGIKKNPVLMMLLGLCPALAVTSKLADAVGMSLAFICVIFLTNLIISLIRKITPDQVRIPTFIIIIASVSTIAELFMKAYAFTTYQALGLYLSLLVVNCIIMGRAEAFASKNKPLAAMVDAISMGIGFAIGIIVIAVCREFLATGGIEVVNPFGGNVLIDTKQWFLPAKYVEFLNDPIKGILNNNGVAPVKPELAKFRERMVLPIFGQPTGAFLTMGLIIAVINAFKFRKSTSKKGAK